MAAVTSFTVTNPMAEMAATLAEIAGSNPASWTESRDSHL